MRRTTLLIIATTYSGNHPCAVAIAVEDAIKEWEGEGLLRFCSVSYYAPFNIISRTFYYYYCARRLLSWCGETAKWFDSIRDRRTTTRYSFVLLLANHRLKLLTLGREELTCLPAVHKRPGTQYRWSWTRERQNFPKASHYVPAPPLRTSGHIIHVYVYVLTQSRIHTYILHVHTVHTLVRTQVHHRLAVLSLFRGKFHHRPCQRQLEYYRASSTTSGNSANRRGKKPLRKTSITLRHR